MTNIEIAGWILVGMAMLGLSELLLFLHIIANHPSDSIKGSSRTSFAKWFGQHRYIGLEDQIYYWDNKNIDIIIIPKETLKARQDAGIAEARKVLER